MAEIDAPVKPKRSGARLAAIIGGGLLLVCLACVGFSLIFAQTPAGRAASTERAAKDATEAATRLTPAPSATIAATQPASATPVPSETALDTEAPNTPRPTPSAPPLVTSTAAATAAPTRPAASSTPANTITLVSLTSPIKPNADAQLVIQTQPGVSCFLTYFVPSGDASSAQGLGATTADGEGRCTWTWKIGQNTGAGTGALSVSAGDARARYDIVIE